jgi:hypothetical protein
MERIMHLLTWTPMRTASKLIAVLAWIDVLSVCFYPLPFWFSRSTSGWLITPISSAPWSLPWISVLAAILIGSIPLVLLWMRGYRRLYRINLLFMSSILLVYSAFILWPVYHSGIDWSAGYPNRVGEGPFYETWYEILMAWLPEPLGWLVWLTLFGGFIAAWYVLPPLGLLTLPLLHRAWSGLRITERWRATSLCVLAIIVPILTWTVSHKFLIWLAE